MNTDRSFRHSHEAHESVATLVRSVPVRLVEVSRSGCRLECTSRIEPGTSGQLAVPLAGSIRIDDVRVARCQQRMGAGALYQIGLELLGTKRLGRRSVRMAIRKIIRTETSVGQAATGNEAPSLTPARTDEVSGMSEGRGPPGVLSWGR